MKATQPNHFIRELNFFHEVLIPLDDFGFAELKVSNAILRHQMRSKTTCRYSYSDFQKATGLSRTGVSNGLKAGIDRKTIKREGEVNNYTYSFQVVCLDYQSEALEEGLEALEDDGSVVSDYQSTQTTSSPTLPVRVYEDYQSESTTTTSLPIEVQIGAKYTQNARESDFPPSSVNGSKPAPNDFEIIANAYPADMLDIHDAHIAFCDLDPKPHASEVVPGIEKWKQSARWQEEDGRYIPKLSNFLLNRRWVNPPKLQAVTLTPKTKRIYQAGANAASAILARGKHHEP